MEKGRRVLGGGSAATQHTPSPSYVAEALPIVECALKASPI
jgi:hypothetical protein